MLLTLLKVLVVVGILQGCVAYIVWVERRLLARMQCRQGPNRVGFGILATLPFIGGLFGFSKRFAVQGLGQPIADGVKLFLKEDVEPAGVEIWTYRLAPIFAILTVFVGYTVIPFGPDIVIAGRTVTLQIAEMPVALLYLLAMGTLGSYGVVLAGWSSCSKYSLMGALRAVAQLVSYELPMGLAMLSVIMLSGSLSLRDIVEAQTGTWWFVFKQPLAFGIAVICAVAEANRTPFDLPEAESELVAGFHTEYSGMKFALFFLAEYAHMFLGGCVLSCLFLGGWHVPFLAPSATPWIAGVLSLGAKVMAFMLFCMWLRATLPRFRYDQLMSFGWKVLTPLAMVNLVLTAIAGKL